MSTVYIGGASIDENGHAEGGTAGNQTGRELRKQAWYKHSKKWYVLRAKRAEVRKQIAAAMRAAIANRRIGYDQKQRNTLYALAELVGFDPSKVTTACETDCSALVRVCVCYAGIPVSVAFLTSNEVKVLMATSEFELLEASQFTDHPDYLLEGDILVTREKGHTVVALNDGDKAASGGTEESEAPYTEPKKLLRKGSTGSGVKWVQYHLGRLGYDLGKWGQDGDFGALTDAALRKFQTDAKIEVDGVVGAETRKALKAA